jgi:hypothetical protein
MLTLKDNPPIVDKDKGIVKIWDDEKNDYVDHSFEFIEYLVSLWSPDWSIP